MTETEKSEKLNLRKWIQITMFPILDAKPQDNRIKLSDHQFVYANMPKAPDLLTGVYGAVSRNDALFLADEYSRKHGKIMYSADVWYRIDDINRTRNQIDSRIMSETGFAHLSGLSTAMRDQLREQWLMWISKDAMPAQMSLVRDLPLTALASRYPQYIRNVFDTYPELLMLVHPVISVMDSGKEQPTLINVATVRIIPERIMHYAVRYSNDIQAVI